MFNDSKYVPGMFKTKAVHSEAENPKMHPSNTQPNIIFVVWKHSCYLNLVLYFYLHLICKLILVL